MQCHVVTLHSRRINTEEKGKVVAAVWGIEFIQFVAELAILHYRTIFKNVVKLSVSSNHPGAIHRILQIVQFQNSLHGK